jgi:hypothetical protein
VNATSGHLTGRFQFHTDHQRDPWWEVDLQANVSIHCIRLFNRVDNSKERCARFSISVRTDNGLFTTVLHEQATPLLFGGLDGEPFEWIAPRPVEARHVRVTLLGRDYLHLDQVEIIGTATPTADTQEKTGRRSWLSGLLRRRETV